MSSFQQAVVSKLIRNKDQRLNLPRFESHNSIGHHCGVCGVPLTNPAAVRKCIGVHEAICPAFHPLFHRIGNVHKCKACKRGKEAIHRRRTDIILKIQEFNRLTEEVKPEEPEEYPVPEVAKLSKRARKAEKARIKAQARTLMNEMVTSKYLEELGSILYPNAEAEDAFNQTLSREFQKQDVSDLDIMGSIVAPMRPQPDYDTEVERALHELRIRPSQNKPEKVLHDKIGMGIREDMVKTYNTYVNLYKRRTQYALWITKGAALSTAWGEQGWDPETGEKLHTPEQIIAETEPDAPNSVVESREKDSIRPFECIIDDRREGGKWIVENMVASPPNSLSLHSRPDEAASETNPTPRVLRLVERPQIVDKEPQIGWNVVGKPRSKFRDNGRKR